MDNSRWSYRKILMYGSFITSIIFVFRIIVNYNKYGLGIQVYILMLGSILALIIFFTTYHGLKKSKSIDKEWERLREERRKEIDKTYRENKK